MTKYSRRMRPCLGTFVEVAVADSESSELAINKAFEQIHQVNLRLSFHDTNSELSKLNQSSGEEISLSPLSMKILRLGKWLMNCSHGAFDFTVGGKLVNLNVLPRTFENEMVEFGTLDDVVIQGLKIKLKKSVKITLDGIAKGYAVDLAIKSLQKAGIKSGWINAGGDLRIFGDAEIPVWQRDINNNNHFVGNFRNTAVATSSILAQPMPNFPGKIVTANSTELSPGTWTVVAKSCWLADALTKVAAVLPPEESRSIIEKLGGQLILSHDTVSS